MKVKTFIRHDCTEDCDVRYYEDGWFLISRHYCAETDEFVQRKALVRFCPLCGKLLKIPEDKRCTLEEFKDLLKSWSDSSSILAGTYTTQ
jgi:Zn finger protein HypA/HybF involved in hydrogenase expression